METSARDARPGAGGVGKENRNTSKFRHDCAILKSLLFFCQMELKVIAKAMTL